ncbi:MAG TPA: fatty acid desaturase [Kofleriaceae bacterium]|nr:fatty acid desaturase [Kofleriaceae bacterium]
MSSSMSLGGDGVSLVPRASYVRALRADLPPHTFDRAPSRLAFVPAHLAIITISAVAIACGWVPWFLVPLLSLAIGASFAGMTFVAHEALHGGIVRGRRLQYAIGALGFLPFVVSPRLWIAWHNGAHHARTNLPDDPDVYPTLDSYRARRSTRFSVDAFALGGRRWRGVLSIILGFTVQSTDQLVIARRKGFLSARQHRRAIVETSLGLAFWAAVAVITGAVPFLFVYVLPLLVANACVMAFILTNHSLSPRVDVNDPLVSGLTVTTSRVVEWLTLGFGFHVEHHLFPAMSSRHARTVRALLLERWPERYQSMPLGEAIRRLHVSARVYQTATTLCDPKTGTLHATLSPRVPASIDARGVLG